MILPASPEFTHSSSTLRLAEDSKPDEASLNNCGSQYLTDPPRSKLWSGASLEERRKLLLTMLDAVYVDSKENTIVAIKPKAPFKPVFAVATTRKDSKVALIHEPESEPRIADQPTPHGHGVEADSCLWSRQRY